MSFPRCPKCPPPSCLLRRHAEIFLECPLCLELYDKPALERRGIAFGTNFADFPEPRYEPALIVRKRPVKPFLCCEPKRWITMPVIVDPIDNKPLPNELLLDGAFAETMNWIARSWRP